MRSLLLPFFIIRLLIKSSPTLFNLFLLKTNPYKSLTIALVLFAFSIILLYQSTNYKRISEKKPSPEKIIKQKEKIERLLNKQPTHRDLLINLSRLDSSLGNVNQAQKLYDQALSLDPNHTYFQEN